MTSSSHVQASSMGLRKACLRSGIVTMLCILVEICFATYKLVKLGKINSENKTTGTSKAAGYGETMVSAFLLLLIITALTSMLVIKGAGHKSRKNLLPWLLSIGPVCLYGSVLVVLDCVVYGMTLGKAVELSAWIVFAAVEVLCFRRVYRYYRHLAHEPHATADGRSLSAVFAISGGGSGFLAVTLFPPTYEEVTLEGMPQYTVTSDGRVVPGDTKPPEYTP